MTAAAALSRCLIVLLSIFLVAIASAPAEAQGDLNASLRRFNELNHAGDYPAALAEAQKFEAAVKARFGVNHANYAIALVHLEAVSGKTRRTE
jgi:hypothetical protein